MKYQEEGTTTISHKAR